MKKIGLILIGLMFVMVVQAQQQKEAYSFQTVTAADTIIITAADGINSVIIRVPSYATDSVLVYGSARTLNSGTVSQVEDGWKIAPGEASIPFGSGVRPIRYLYIIVRNIAQIGTMSETR